MISFFRRFRRRNRDRRQEQLKVLLYGAHLLVLPSQPASCPEQNTVLFRGYLPAEWARELAVISLDRTGEN